MANDAKGVLDRGTVYVLRDAHNSLEDVETTLSNELYGHAAVRALSGGEQQPKLRTLISYEANRGQRDKRIEHKGNWRSSKPRCKSASYFTRVAFVSWLSFAYFARKSADKFAQGSCSLNSAEISSVQSCYSRKGDNAFVPQSMFRLKTICMPQRTSEPKIVPCTIRRNTRQYRSIAAGYARRRTFETLLNLSALLAADLG